MTGREEFTGIYREKIKREGADRLLDYLSGPQSDFFDAPASARYHCSYAGGLCEHSLNVYDCLCDYLERERVRELYGMEYSPETVAVVALLHDVCKINCYRTLFRNVKNDRGVWESVPYYEFDDRLPYGHGEKSVYIISGYMKLTREEAFAIRYHMGFSAEGDNRSLGKVFEMFPLAFALHAADSEATFFLEGKEQRQQ